LVVVTMLAGVLGNEHVGIGAVDETSDVEPHGEGGQDRHEIGADGFFALDDARRVGVGKFEQEIVGNPLERALKIAIREGGEAAHERSVVVACPFIVGHGVECTSSQDAPPPTNEVLIEPSDA
jgi:hypothetical protein